MRFGTFEKIYLGYQKFDSHLKVWYMYYRKLPMEIFQQRTFFFKLYFVGRSWSIKQHPSPTPEISIDNTHIYI